MKYTKSTDRADRENSIVVPLTSLEHKDGEVGKIKRGRREEKGGGELELTG